ncbi:polymorphic toxin type 17 domain-containing protein [Actinoplanes teichomyceticus]|uniref:Putative RNase toxin 17 of polymorphic toxin system n=1 Tax=Actinoplanes teichomyceticus TaxID=1867 RepID=A0A561VKU9_ACTTI|nr:polymorphic toxin type 17 domain-containing protein [Actinoplanes teichomyceticus]TWG12252.1 putative RNase toxin 17 of polymorphic toxin system [Actinoplanes teichomyceticus]GIF14189.1 hypothetical protein Ate01nite_42210 [Actinoplanes teichomyceticus]
MASAGNAARRESAEVAEGILARAARRLLKRAEQAGRKRGSAATRSAARSGTKGRIKDAGLPTRGRIRYVPPKGYNPSMPLPRGPGGGYVDRFGNEWVKGPSRTSGHEFEWDVQLRGKGRTQLGKWTRDGSHANVSLDGHITHK